MSVSKRVRFEIFKRDQFTCQYCGRTPPAVTLQVDHVVPSSAGGSNDPANLVTSCFDCNSGKSNIPLGCIPTAAKQQIQERQELDEQVRAHHAFLAEARKREDAMVESLSDHYASYLPGEGNWHLSKQCKTSVRLFLRRLPFLVVQDAIDLAMSKKTPVLIDGKMHDNTWRYFCAICWNKIRESEQGGK